MPPTQPIKPLYDAMETAATELSAAQAKYDAAKAALVSAMPEGEEFCVAETHPPIIKCVGGEIVSVTKPYIGATP